MTFASLCGQVIHLYSEIWWMTPKQCRWGGGVSLSCRLLSSGSFMKPRGWEGPFSTSGFLISRLCLQAQFSRHCQRCTNWLFISLCIWAVHQQELHLFQCFTESQTWVSSIPTISGGVKQSRGQVQDQATELHDQEQISVSPTLSESLTLWCYMLAKKMQI